MRRAIVTSTASVSGIILLLGLKAQSGGIGSHTAVPISSGSNPAAAAPSTGAPAAPGAAGSSAPAKAPTTAAAAAGGTRVITGTAVDTRYGPVQVKVTFVGKKISNIDVVQYPTESGRDQEINSFALPILNQEAIAAQSANIDTVSGATYSSQGYLSSLQSAIDQAGA